MIGIIQQKAKADEPEKGPKLLSQCPRTLTSSVARLPCT